MLVEVFSDAVEQLLVEPRAAPARGDAAQRLKVQARRLRSSLVGHRDRETREQPIEVFADVLDRIWSVEDRLLGRCVVPPPPLPGRLKPNGGGTSRSTWLARTCGRRRPRTTSRGLRRSWSRRRQRDATSCAAVDSRQTCRDRHGVRARSDRPIGSDRSGPVRRGRFRIGWGARSIRCVSSPLPQLQDDAFVETSGSGCIGDVFGRRHVELHSSREQMGGVLHAVGAAEIHASAGRRPRTPRAGNCRAPVSRAGCAE